MTRIVAVLVLVCAWSHASAQRLSPQGGTITGATSGGGLQVTNAKLGLITSCASGEVLAWNGSTWACASAGDITGVTASTGLSGGGTSGTVSLAIDPTYTQRRVSGTCAAGSSIRVVNEDGTVACEADDTGGTITGGANVVLKGDGAGNAVASSWTDDGTTAASTDVVAWVATASGAGATGTLKVAADVEDTTDARNGWAIISDAGGSNRFDSKTASGGTTAFRYGSGTGHGYDNTWLSLAHDTGAVTASGAWTHTGNLTSGDAPGDVFDHNGNLALFGATSQVYFNANTLNWEYDTNATATAFVNYYGYQGGATQFRDLIIADGKNATAATFTGSDKSLAVVGNLTTNGTFSKVDSDTTSTNISIGQDWGAVNGDFYLATLGASTDIVLAINGSPFLRLDGDDGIVKVGADVITLNAATGAGLFTDNLTTNGDLTAGDDDLDSHQLQGVVTVRKTGLDSAAEMFFQNDAKTWHIGTFGSLGDVFGVVETGVAVWTQWSAGGLLAHAGDAQLGDAPGDTVYAPGYVGIGTSPDSTAKLKVSGGNAWLNADGASVATADGHGLLSVDSLYAGGAKDIADTFIAGWVRPETGAGFYLNWLSSTNTLTDGGSCVDNIWCQNEAGPTLEYTTSTQTSPRGISETVGQLTCTDGGSACSAGGADYRYVGNEGGTGAGSIPYTDARNLTVTFSVWVKRASGTGTTRLAVARDGDAEWSSSDCSTTSTTWTRCSLTKTLSNTNLTDNSEIRVYLYLLDQTTHYLWGAQLEEASIPTPYRAKSGLTTFPDGYVSIAQSPYFQLGGVHIQYQSIWAPEAHFRNEQYEGFVGSPNRGVSIYGDIGGALAGQGMVEADHLSARSSLSAVTAVIGSATFLNGPAGHNTFAGTHLEWTEEWFYSYVTGGTAIGPWTLRVGGTGAYALVAGGVAGTGRPSVQESSTGTTATGRGGTDTSDNFVDFSTGSWAFRGIYGVPVLSTAAQEYAVLIGFFDSWTTVDQTDGCYVLYDQGAVAATPDTGSEAAADTLNCVCAKNGTRTQYPMDGSTVSDESFTTVDTPVGAVTWSTSTNDLVLEIRMTGSTRAEFYVGDSTGALTKRCNIATNIPDSSSRLMGLGHVIIKSAGTTARTLQFDHTGWSVDLTAAR